MRFFLIFYHQIILLNTIIFIIILFCFAAKLHSKINPFLKFICYQMFPHVPSSVLLALPFRRSEISLTSWVFQKWFRLLQTLVELPTNHSHTHTHTKFLVMDSKFLIFCSSCLFQLIKSFQSFSSNRLNIGDDDNN